VEVFDPASIREYWLFLWGTTSLRYIAPARTAHKTSFIIACCSLVARKTMSPQNCSLATAVVLPPVYIAVISLWVYKSLYNTCALLGRAVF
jgi:hypothetical protein